MSPSLTFNLETCLGQDGDLKWTQMVERATSWYATRPTVVPDMHWYRDLDLQCWLLGDDDGLVLARVDRRCYCADREQLAEGARAYWRWQVLVFGNLSAVYSSCNAAKRRARAVVHTCVSLRFSHPILAPLRAEEVVLPLPV